MPFNGSGQFSKVFSWEADAAAGINITASRFDTQESDFTGNGFDNCLTRDGQGQPTANLPMAGFRHTGVGDGQAASDYASVGQAQNGSLNWTIASGTSDAITAIYTPSIAALTDGLIIHFRASAANLTTTPTFAPNGLTAHTITKNGGQALAIGDICGNLNEVTLRYNLANTRWELLNPPSVPIGGIVPYFGGSVPSGFVLPQGQNIAIASFPALNAVIGTTYGNPGGGNISAPDLRGRAFAGLDAGGSGRITVAGGNFDGTVLGGNGGSQNRTASTTLSSTNQLPQFTPSFSGTLVDMNTQILSASGRILGAVVGGGLGAGTSGTGVGEAPAPSNYTPAGTIGAIGSASPSAATSASFSTLPPIMTINVMMRIA